MTAMFNNIWFTIIIAIGNISLFRYLLYLFLAPIQSLQARKLSILANSIGKRELEKIFKVSVIIPAWNEGVGIITSIKSVLSNNYNNLEIIVVNDGSTDCTDEVVRSFVNGDLNHFNDRSLKYVLKERGGKGSALNAGIKASSGNIIVTMDADTIFEPDAIYNAVKYFVNKDVDAAVGNVKVSANSSLLAIIQQIEYTMGFYFKRVHSLLNSEYIIGGAFGIFRKEVFEKYGYFDELCKTEDIEFSTRLKFNGCKTVYVEDAIAYTEGASTISGLCKQRLRWKKGRLDTFLRYSNMIFSLDKKHNKFLTFFIMPWSLFSDMLLIIEPFISFFILFIVLTEGGFDYFLAWISFITLIIGISYLFGSSKNSWKSFVMIPLFYFLQFVLIWSEIYAILGSFNLYLKNKDVVWQSWSRKGIKNV